MLEKVGTYYYFFPTYNQGKKILWNGIDKDGFKFLNHIPEELRVRTSSQEMLIELKNGSIFQIIGTDNVDSIVGTNPIGSVFSEYALQDPIAWGYIRPILAENGGWAVFNFTSRGKNHGYDLVKYAKTQDDWFVQILPATETSVFTPEQLEKEREQYLIEDGDDLRFQQEYMCSFEGSMQGSYYGKLMAQAEKDNRITKVPYEPQLPVYTIWDLGMADAMSIWFLQIVGKELRFIDYLEGEGEGMAYYAKELNDKGYVYSEHFLPHDADVREIGTGVSRKATAESLGIKPIRIVPKLPIDEGIASVRLILPRSYFDEDKCKRGIDCLRQYHKEFDEKNKCFKNKPKHDWSSHGSDSMRYTATAIFRFIEMKLKPQQVKPEFKINKW